MRKENFPVDLAWRTLKEFLGERKVPSPLNIPLEFQKKAGVFVSLHKKGELRGCIGTYLPTQKNIAEEIIRNAISAATQDPRFPPVREEELKEIEISVDILSEPELIHSLNDLNPRKYGVIVSKEWQKGLLLPDLEGVNTVETQLKIAKQKAGLLGVPLTQLKIYRFTVTRYKESSNHS